MIPSQSIFQMFNGLHSDRNVQLLSASFVRNYVRAYFVGAVKCF